MQTNATGAQGLAIPNELDALDKDLALLQDAAGMLTERLVPVTAPMPPTVGVNKTDECEASPGVPLAETLNRFRDRVADVTRRLRDATDRLQL